MHWFGVEGFDCDHGNLMDGRIVDRNEYALLEASTVRIGMYLRRAGDVRSGTERGRLSSLLMLAESIVVESPVWNQASMRAR